MTDSEIIRPDSLKTLRNFTAVCSILLAACTPDDPRQYIENGKELFQKGELQSARVEFLNALQLDPKLADAYFQLGLVDERNQNWAGMLGNLMEAVSLDPKHLEGQLKLGQIFLVGGQIEKAEERTRTALQIKPDDITAQLMQVSIHLRLGHYRAALQGANKILDSHPFMAEAMALKANVLASNKQLDAAIEVIATAIEHNPADVDLRLLKIRFETENRQFDAAVGQYRQLIAEHPELTNLPGALADLLSDMGQKTEAETVLRASIDQHPTEIQAKLRLVDWLEKHRTEQTEATLQGFIQQEPDVALLKFRLADYYLKQRGLTDAASQFQVIADLYRDAPDGLIAKVKLAELALARNEDEKVRTLAEEILSIDSANSDALLLRAGVRLIDHDLDGAVADLRIVLRDRPDSQKAMLLLAQANLLKGESEVAESQWRKMLQADPNNKAAVVALGNELLKRGDLSRAEELAIKAAKINPNDPAPLEILIRLKSFRKDWQGAEEIVGQLDAIPQGQALAKYWHGILVAQQGRGNEAIQAYQAALEMQPGLSKALSALSQVYESAGRLDDLIGYLKKFASEHAAVIPAQVLLAAAYGAQNNWAASDTVLRKASEMAPQDLELKLQWLNAIERQSAARAEETLKAWLAADSRQTRLKFRLANFYAERQRGADAEPLLREVAAADPTGREGLAAKLKLAELAWARKEATLAETLLSEVVAEKPLKNEALLLRASIHQTQNQQDAAIADLQQLLKNQPTSEAGLRMLAEAYQNADNRKALTGFLKALLKNNQDVDALVAALATAYAADKEWLEAERLLRDKLKRTPRDGQAYVLLARILASQGKDGEVDAVYRVGLGAVLNPQALMTEQARFYVYKQDFAKAIAIYAELVDKFSSDDEAVNNLALLLVTHQADNQASIARALSLVERYQNATNPAIQDTYGWVQLKAGHVQNAVTALKLATQSSPSDPSIRYHLAEALLQLGDSRAAVGELEQAVALAARHGAFPELDTAKRLLNQLKTVI